MKETIMLDLIILTKNLIITRLGIIKIIINLKIVILIIDFHFIIININDSINLIIKINLIILIIEKHRIKDIIIIRIIANNIKILIQKIHGLIN